MNIPTNHRNVFKRVQWNAAPVRRRVLWKRRGTATRTAELGDTCSICRLDYSEECECPGPTQDGMEYETFHGVLMARPILGENAEVETRRK